VEVMAETVAAAVETVKTMAEMVEVMAGELIAEPRLRSSNITRM